MSSQVSSGFRAPCDMTEKVEESFKSFILQGKLRHAFNVINSYYYSFTPTSYVINEIIFKIIMNGDLTLARDAAQYLAHALATMPTDEGHKLIFIEGLKDKTGLFPSVWDAFAHFVVSCLRYKEITDGHVGMPGFVPHPICDILAVLFVKVLLKSPFKSHVLEPNLEGKFTTLMKWINMFYKYNIHREDVLKYLHLLLDYIIDCVISTDPAVPKCVAMHNTTVLEYIFIILNTCKDAFASPENQQKFFFNTESPYLIVKVCKYRLDDLIDEESVPQNSVMSLKSIVDNYFFYRPKQKSQKKTQASIDSPRNPERRKKLKEHSKDSVTGDTEFHLYCRSNRLDDLRQAFRADKSKDINAKNSVGNTPLHEACLNGSYSCCKFLIEATDERKVDLRATDNEGRIPLYFAVYKNARNIVNLLLNSGGYELVQFCDNDGNKAIDFAESQEMINLLHAVELKVEFSDDESQERSDAARKLPNLKNMHTWGIYLRTLRSLIREYCNIYNILRDKIDVQPLSHCAEECYHYKVSEMGTLCDEDFKTLATFRETILKLCTYAERDLSEVNVEKEIRELRILSCSFR